MQQLCAFMQQSGNNISVVCANNYHSILIAFYIISQFQDYHFRLALFLCESTIGNISWTIFPLNYLTKSNKNSQYFQVRCKSVVHPFQVRFSFASNPFQVRSSYSPMNGLRAKAQRRMNEGIAKEENYFLGAIYSSGLNLVMSKYGVLPFFIVLSVTLFFMVHLSGS